MYNEWNRVFDALEILLVELVGERIGPERFSGMVIWRHWNLDLRQNNVGFRISAEGQVVPITNEAEMAAVEAAQKTGVDAVNDHVREAIVAFTHRPDPEYATAIARAVSAVESACLHKTGDKDLKTALRTLSTNGMHAALKDGLGKFYGWASDDSGIRHGKREGQGDVGFQEAKLALVICSSLATFVLEEL